MPRRGRRGRLVAPICAAVLLAGCGTAGPSDPAPSPSGSIGAEISADAVADLLPNDLAAETSFGMDRSAWEQLKQDAMLLPWRVVSARAVEQAAACIGQGAPTVVYLDGFGSPATPHWSQAAVAQSESNRVYLFDRPGMGLSPYRAGATPHSTPEQHTQEMLNMLQVLGEPSPYLLAGWSYGGLVARTAAAQAGQPFDDAPAGWEETWNDLQVQAATISDNSLRAVVDDSDHAIPIRNPGGVVAATTAVAESIRAGNAPLPPCPDDLAAAVVTCTGG